MITNQLDQGKYAQAARAAAAEGCVLLKNNNNTLPLRKNDRVAIFGRNALNYYKSGLGSGGLVNTSYVISILDALQTYPEITLEKSVLKEYHSWCEHNPIDQGKGWGTVPWSQKEMPLSDETVDQAKLNADVALVLIGRTAGEDQDNSNSKGSYLLTDTETQMIAKVSAAFERTVVLLNVGNIIGMDWVDKYNPAAVMYVWQGGQEGGNGVLDVLTGRVNPCGKLTDTIAYSIADYPSTDNFGDPEKNYYKEDIYVGYRYFETFAKEKVQYPFGFGLSYTTFAISGEVLKLEEDKLSLKVKVQNTGIRQGKEVAQIYVKAPQGKLGKPDKVLVGFIKTANLLPGEVEEQIMIFPKAYFASFDDSGVTGNKSCFVLEAGQYEIYVGGDVRDSRICGCFEEELSVIEVLEEACAPVEEFDRYHAQLKPDGSYKIVKEIASQRTVDPENRRRQLLPEAVNDTGDQGYQLRDVQNGTISMEQFVAQLSDEDFIDLFHGEGMCSLKVTPGTAGAFGGLTKSAEKFGIPAACCADGPSGIRMDCGTEAFSLPNGTALGCSFNVQLIQELFECVGQELLKNRIDTLLGPGINIHRNPLNGRNFEYISEDPILSGKMAVAQLRGMEQSGIAGTIKHFCANNQEQNRCVTETVVSERSLREIYLKGFELAVKEGKARSVMTTYGPVNGVWTAGSYDLNTIILRKQWGFTGIVMTDWWATANWEGEEADKKNRSPMVLAQNDLYMCCADAKEELDFDNVRQGLHNGQITRGELQRNAVNILTFIMNSPAMNRKEFNIGNNIDAAGKVGQGEAFSDESIKYYQFDEDETILTIAKEEAQKRWESKCNWGLMLADAGKYSIILRYQSESGELAQIPVSIYVDNIYRKTVTLRGTDGKWQRIEEILGEFPKGNHYLKMVHQADGLNIETIKIKKG